jgi:hypothetical protein
LFSNLALNLVNEITSYYFTGIPSNNDISVFVSLTLWSLLKVKAIYKVPLAAF